MNEDRILSVGRENNGVLSLVLYGLSCWPLERSRARSTCFKVFPLSLCPPLLSLIVPPLAIPGQISFVVEAAKQASFALPPLRIRFKCIRREPRPPRPPPQSQLS